MNPKTRKLMLTILRVAICIAALGWVLQGVTIHDKVTLRSGRVVRLLALDEKAAHVTVRHPDGREKELPLDQIAEDDKTGAWKITYGLATAWRNSNKAVLPFALLVFAPVVPLQSLRFLMMFRAQDIRLGFWESLKLCFAGNFLNFVALGSTGGDVVKAYYVCLHTDRRTEAVTTILLDRIIGLTGMVVLVGLIIFVFTTDPLLRAVGYAIALFIAAVVVASILLVTEAARASVRVILPVHRITRIAGGDSLNPPGKVAAFLAWSVEQVGRVDATTRRLIRHKPLVIGSILVTVLLQFIALSSYQVVVHALDMPQDASKVWEYYAFLGSGNIAAALPITYQGVGVMEALYKKFMSGRHGTIAQILCLAMGVRIIHLTWALPGFLVTLTGSYRPRESGGHDSPGATAL